VTSTSLALAHSRRLDNATSRIGRAKLHRKASFASPFLPRLPAPYSVKAACFFTAYPDMAVEMGHRRARQRSSKDGFDWLSTQVIFQIPLWLLEGSRRRRPFSSPPSIPHTLRRTGIAARINRFDIGLLSSGPVRPWSFGSGRDAKRCPHRSLRTQRH